MAKLSRRGFFKQTSATAATIGVMAALPAMAATAANEAPAEAPAVEASVADFTEPLMAHVSDIASGEISLLMGTREVIFRDPQLVMRLLQAAR